jgi:DNA-binding IclR family transcriptional regulator
MAEASTRSVERVLALLATVCEEGTVTLTEAAAHVDLPISTALRLLRSLSNEGFVSRDEDGLFHVGPRMMQLGAASLSRSNLIRLAAPIMDSLALETGESVYLASRGFGDTALYIHISEGTQSIRHTSWVGRTIPLHASAAGQALLGNVAQGEYLTLKGSVEPDVTAIASPIRVGDRVLAALNLVIPSYRVTEENATAFGGALAREANRISSMLFALPKGQS